MLIILISYLLIGYLKVNNQLLDVDEYIVSEVLDGDTIKVNKNGIEQTVRYIGIDTPEIEHFGKQVECYGKEATERNKELVLGKKVTLIKDKTDKDKYGRSLRYIKIEDKIVNIQLIEEGYAYELLIPPNVKYSKLIKQKVKEAQQNLKGVWVYCANDDKRAVIKNE